MTVSTAHVSRCCNGYREQLGKFHCEISHLIVADTESASWMQKQIDASPGIAYALAVHHLWGRTGGPQLNWYCSLIQTWTVSHLWCHAFPSRGEIVCIKSKMDRWKDWLKKHPINNENLIKPEYRWWHPLAMGQAIRSARKPGIDLAARVGILAEKAEHPLFERYAVEILDFLSPV